MNDTTTPGIRVLLVDDNGDVRESTRMVLEMLGLEVVAVDSGQAALAVGGDFEPEAILLDIGLPGMDGWATAIRIRQEPWGRSATLIAMTGWGRAEDVERSRASGFDYHLLKPMDPDKLVSLLESARHRAV